MKVSEFFGLKGKHFKSIFEKFISFWVKAYILVLGKRKETHPSK